MTTKEQQDAWYAVCNEGGELGLWFVHIPDTALWTVYPLWPKDGEVHYIRHNDPDAAIKAAKHSIAFKRAYPVATSDPVELKARLAAFNTQSVE